MRIAIRVVLMILALFMIAQSSSNRVVLNQANIDVAPMIMNSSSQAQTSLSFRIAGIEEEPTAVAGMTYQNITAITPNPMKFGVTGEEGLPELPVFAHLIGIPDQSGVRIEILSSSYEIIENVDVMPSQPSPVEGSPEIPPFTKDDAFYQKNEFYPSEVAQLGEPIICRDLRMIQVEINPVQYNPVTKQLKVYTSIDYNLVYEGTDSRNIKIRRNNNISETFLPLYRSLIPNADEMLADYNPIRGGYLILTPDAFADTIQQLARWKHLKGYSVVVTRATELAPSGTPSSSQIFTYIQNAYQTWAVPPEFVCIVGDESGLTTYFQDSPYGGGYASDQDYSCVDGSDYLSDVMVTRMSVPNSIATLRVAMWKAIKYDSDPFMGDPGFYARGLSVGGNVGGAITPRLTTLWVREQLLRHGYSQVDTAFCTSSSWSCNADPQIPLSFNNGVGITNVRGAGSASGWWAPPFNTGNIDQLTANNKMGVLAVLTCGTGQFGEPDCFGEHWIRAGILPNALKGGPAYYGVSDGSTHTKWNNPIMIGFNWAYLEEGIYNFASAAFRGKLEDYNTYPRFVGPGSWVEHYFHTYNTLGEPELEIRTAAPVAMTATYTTTIPVGSSMLAVHVTDASRPLVGAYVCLQKDAAAPDGEVFVGGRTDSNGDITFNFNTTVAGTMNVTITSHNYIPHRGTVAVQAQAVAVNINSIALDDDNSGNSSGNSDGNVNPSETVEFAVALRNFGNSITATNVNATLTTPNSDITITVPTQSYGSIAPGGIANSNKFAAHFANNLPQGEHYILQLNITSDQGSWTAAVPVDIKSMLFSLQGMTFPNDPNSRLDPGDSSQFVVTLQNIGELGGTSLVGNLTCPDTGVAIVSGTGSFGNIPIGGSGSNSGTPFIVQISPEMYQGHNLNFNLMITSSNGSVTNKVISVVAGNIVSTDPMGPDNYGYYIYDNTDAAFMPSPIYNWVEVSPYAGGSGTRVVFPGSNTDDNAEVISLPFNLKYYGQNFTNVLVCINGFVAFDTSRVDIGGNHWTAFDNSQIPEPGAPDGIIAPFWDDLEYTGNDGVFKYYDTANNRFILEWKNCTHAGQSTPYPETFQMIIYDNNFYPTPTGDCEIVFQYQVVYNNDNDTDNPLQPGLYCTVGMQNLSNSDGLQYTYDNFYHPGAAVLEAGRAIKITTAVGLQQPPNMAYDPSSFAKNANMGQIVLDTLTISNTSGGPLVFSLNSFADNRLLSENVDRRRIQEEYANQKPIGYTQSIGAKPDDANQPIYPPMPLNQGGPDIFGNIWIDSDEPGGPSYSWVDISGSGTPVSLTDDSFAGPIDMGMNFYFYGTDYSQIYIGSNGIVSFGAGTNSYSNINIPNAADPNNFIAACWDDMNPGAGGSIYYYHDTANNRFIVSYVALPFYSGAADATFEIILYPNGRVLMEYGSLNPGSRGLNQLTVGIENVDGTDGLQVVNNANYLHTNMAILYSPPARWLLTNIHEGIVVAGMSAPAVVTFDATELPAGIYTGHLDLDTNDPNLASVDIPVNFNVGNAQLPNIVQTPNSFTDTLYVGNSRNHTLKIKNTGVGILTISFTHVGSWITIAPGPYNINPSDSLMQTLTVNASAMSPGAYSGSITTLSNDPDSPSINTPLTLLVRSLPRPRIDVASTGIVDTLNQGTQTTRNIKIRNLGDAPLIVTLSAIENSIALHNSNDAINPLNISGKKPIEGQIQTLDNQSYDPPLILNTWLFISPAVDTVAAGDSITAIVTLNASAIAPGPYLGHINLASNDPDFPSINIQVNLQVLPAGPDCIYVAGDVNGNGSANGLDVTYAVNFFKGGSEPPISCDCPPHGIFFVGGDVNGSCSFNGLDVTYMVNYFKGGPSYAPCVDCPPTGIAQPASPVQPVKKPDTSTN